MIFELKNVDRGLDVISKTVKASVNDKSVSDFPNIILNDGEEKVRYCLLTCVEN